MTFKQNGMAGASANAIRIREVADSFSSLKTPRKMLGRLLTQERVRANRAESFGYMALGLTVFEVATNYAASFENLSPQVLRGLAVLCAVLIVLILILAFYKHERDYMTFIVPLLVLMLVAIMPSYPVFIRAIYVVALMALALFLVVLGLNKLRRIPSA